MRNCSRAITRGTTNLLSATDWVELSNVITLLSDLYKKCVEPSLMATFFHGAAKLKSNVEIYMLGKKLMPPRKDAHRYILRDERV